MSENKNLEIFGAKEFANSLNVSTKTFYSWYNRRKLPEPYTVLACGPIWTGSQVDSHRKMLESNEKSIQLQPGRKPKKIEKASKYIFGESERRLYMPAFISCANNKGGVAKSTTIANLAAICAEDFRLKVLAVDMDQQANLTMGLGVIFDDDNLPHIPHLLMGQAKLEEVVFKTSIPNLSIIPSSLYLGMYENELINKMFRERRLYNALSVPGIQEYDVVFIDTPPSLGIFLQNSLVVSDYVIIPVTPEPWGLKGVNGVLELIRALQNDLVSTNIDKLKEIRILITRYDQRVGTHQSLFKLINDTFSDSMLRTYIKINAKITDAQGYGVPISSYLRSSQGYLDYHQLATEIIESFVQPHLKKKIVLEGAAVSNE